MVYGANFHASATSSSWHLWKIDIRFALNSTPGRRARQLAMNVYQYTHFSISARGSFLSFSQPPSLTLAHSLALSLPLSHSLSLLAGIVCAFDEARVLLHDPELSLSLSLSLSLTHSHTLPLILSHTPSLPRYSRELPSSSLTSLLTSDDAREAHSFLQSDEYYPNTADPGGRADSIPDIYATRESCLHLRSSACPPT